MFTEVYIGIGGNIGDSFAIICQALDQIKALKGIHSLETSRFYRTTPVSPIPQPHYINAVCRCSTSYTALQLFEHLMQIETSLGKVSKAKDAPRPIDLDILFFGKERFSHPLLEIPHPRWKERLFVLRPLLDLTSEITIPQTDSSGYQHLNLLEYLQGFPNPNHETVTLIEDLHYGFHSSC